MSGALVALFLPLSCGTSTLDQVPASQSQQEVNEFWNQGLAEVTSYKLSQARYGELREGTAVTVFVTEPFSKSKQVKLDDPGSVPQDAVQVMKLNMTKNFTTGIYPYSMMTSVFSPLTDFSPTSGKYDHALKVTTSSQEWCGHTFTQLNQNRSGYKVDNKSYFESEGDKELHVDQVWLEDELWACLRQNPKKLPVDKFEILPSTMSLRLRHRPLAPVGAEAWFEILEEHVEYHVQFTDDRKLTISFIDEFPFQIIGWTETYNSGFGPSATELTTTATMLETKMLDYWNHNSNDDQYLRKELRL